MGYTVSTILVLALAMPAAAGEPIGWRRDGSGKYDTGNPPLRWSAGDNVVWKTPLPAPSKGSPIVVGDHVFLLSYPTSLLCIGRSDGTLLWKKTNAYSEAVAGAEGKRLESEFPAKPLKDLYWPAGDDLSQTTPVSDGKFVYSVFGTGVVSAHALDGTRKWITFVERPAINYGQASSPLLVGGLLIAQLNDLVALDPQSGREVWRTKLAATQATPAVATIGETQVLAHPAGALVRVSDGKVLASDLFNADRASPLVQGDKVFVHGETFFYAMQLPNSISEAPRKLWESKATYAGYTIASPVLHEGRLFGVNRNGILEIVDAQSGEVTQRQRLSIGNKVHSGISLANGLLYVGNEKGTHLVLRADATGEEVARNDLGEQIDASPVFAGDRLYLRGEKHLYCIGK